MVGSGGHRIKGELLQLSGRTSEAEASFRQAIEVARRQEAKSWELRATISLSRLLQKEGRSAEARQLLSEIYGWFTEGFDTPDLKEAKALLEELRGKAWRGGIEDIGFTTETQGAQRNSKRSLCELCGSVVKMELSLSLNFCLHLSLV